MNLQLAMISVGVLLGATCSSCGSPPERGPSERRPSASAVSVGDHTDCPDPPRRDLDTDHPIEGRVHLDREMPEDEVLEVVLVAPRRSGGGDRLGGAGGPRTWTEPSYTEVARAPVAADGTFRVPCVVAASAVLLRIEGDYVSGWLELDSDDLNRDGEGLIEIEARVGGHVTIELYAPADATAEERAALVGRTLSISGRPDYVQSGPTNTYDFGVAPSEGATGDAILIAPGLPAWPFDLDLLLYGDDPQLGVSPFVVPLDLPQFTPVPCERTRVEVRLERGRSIEVRVTDPNGAPIPHAVACVICSNDWGSEVLHRLATDQNGVANFPAVQPSVEQLIISSDAHLPFIARGEDLDELLRDGGPIDIGLHAGGTIHGRVTLPSGRPVAGLYVKAFAPKIPGSSGKRRSDLTDDDGRFVLRGLTHESHQVRTYARRIDVSGDGPVRADVSNSAAAGGRSMKELSEWVRPGQTSADEPVELVVELEQ